MYATSEASPHGQDGGNKNVLTLELNDLLCSIWRAVSPIYTFFEPFIYLMDVKQAGDVRVVYQCVAIDFSVFLAERQP